MEGVASAQTVHPAMVHAARRGGPWISLRDGQAVATNYVGERSAAQLVRGRGVRALAAAKGDFDEDGMPDLVSGYAAAGGGLLTVHRGNVNALWPYGDAIRNGEPPAFLPDARVFTLPEAPDFLGAGDFDADGHWDIVAARRGSSRLYFLRGDGHGGFAEPQTRALPGGVTALITAELNRPDGLTDLVVAVTGDKGSQVLVFESPEGALRGDPEVISAPSPVSGLAAAPLGGHGIMNDLAIAAGRDLLLVHGRDRMLSEVKAVRDAVGPATVTRQSLPFAVTALATGNFTSTGLDLAALGDDGKIHLLERGDAAEQAALADMPPTIMNRKGETASHGGRGGTIPGNSRGTENRQALLARAKSKPKALVLRGEVDLPAFRQLAPRLVAARVSTTGGDDLIVTDNSASQVHIVSRETGQISTDAAASAPRMHLAASLDVAQGGPAAVLPMRLHPAALSDLVILHADQPEPSVTPTAGTTYTVTNTVDDGTLDIPNYTPGSLRKAILDASLGGGLATVVFNIPTTDPNYNPDTGVFTITPKPNTNCGGNATLFAPCHGLPFLPAGMTVDAYTQPGASPNTSANGDNAVLKIQINGALAQQGPSGLMTFIGGSATIRGFVINGFAQVYNPSQKSLNGGSGIDIESGGNFVEGNFLGTDSTGTYGIGNGIGLQSFASGGNTFGGTTLQARNLVSGNSFAGVGLGATPPPNTFFVQGNFLGTDRTGTQQIPNSGSGVTTAGFNVVTGGTVAGARNIIGGTNSGVYIHCYGCIASLNVVQGNYIGTDVTGTRTVSNGSGVAVDLANQDTIGGTTPGARNVISGNQDGIQVFDSSEQNLIQGNLIGTDATGAAALANLTGINHTPRGTYPANGTTIGGESAGAGNVISGNLTSGIEFGGAAVQEGLTDGGYCCQLNHLGNTVKGNLIGTDATGVNALGNGSAGILFDQGGSYAQIGGTDTEAANVIAFNAGDGVRVDPAANYSLSTANLGGVAVVGNAIFSNGGAGVRVISGIGSTVSQNSIYSNGHLGVDTGTAGENTISSCNSNQSGANNLQNAPALTVASGGATLVSATATDPGGNTSEFSNCATMATLGSALNIVGQLNSLPNTNYRIEFFQNTSCDASGFGQGKTFLHAISVTTAGNCIATFGDSVIPADADLSVTLGPSTSAFAAVPFPNTFVSVVTNNGPATANNVSFTNTLPSTFSFSSATTTQGTCTPAGNTVTCSLGNMPAGATVTVTVIANAVSTGTQPVTVNATTSTTDSNPANNSASLSVAVNNPFPAIDRLSPASVVAGGGNLPLTIIGATFLNGVTTVTFNTTSLPYTFLANQPCSNGVVACQGLQVTVPAALVASAGTPNVTVTNPAPGGGSNSAVFTIFASVGGVTHFSVTGFPNPTTAGVVNSFTVAALDANGSVVPAYRGTVQFRTNGFFSLAGSDGNPVPNYTFIAGDNGQHTFQAQLQFGPTQSIDVSDAGTPSVTGSESVTVQPAPASRIIDFFDGNGTPIGFPFDPFREVVTDPYSNSIPNIPVTFRILKLDGVTPATPTDPGCTFPNGQQTFTINTDANGQVLVTCTANLIAGEFTVLVTVPGNNINIGGTNYGAAVDIFPTSNNNPPAHLTPYAPLNNQTAQVNTKFRFGLGVIVTDASNNIVPNMTVNFAVNPASNGASATLDGTTGVSERTVDPVPGLAHVSAPMANGTVGSYTVTASLGSLTTNISLTNSPGPNPVAGISIFSGTPQSTPINTPFPAPLKAYPYDAQVNPLGNVPVTFTAPSTGPSATLSATNVTSTAPNGLAIVNATANGIPGTYQVTVSAAGFSQTYTLTNTSGTSNTIYAVSGTPQTTPVSSAFGTVLQVAAVDPNGKPLSGMTITFAAPGSGASATLSNTSVVTNASGFATITAVANATAGSFSVTATLGSSTATFSLTNTAVTPGSLTATSGTPQTANTNAPFGTQLFATLRDTSGNPMNNVLVQFSAPASGASATLSSSVALTNSLGVANVAATANGTTGSYSVTASAGALNATFSLTNTTPVPAGITATGGTPQSTAVNAAFTTTLQATVKDASGLPMSGVTVNFTPPASGAGATLSSGSAVTNSAGNATVTATANGTSGSYSVTAGVAGLGATATFSLTNAAAPPAAIVPVSGSTPQSTAVGTAFGAALAVKVTDAGNNPLGGITVTFTPPASGASAGLSGNTAVTNGSGIASVTATANHTVGSYSVTASVVGLGSTATFALTNTTGPVATVLATAGTPQSTTVNTAFATALQVTVQDAFSNPISGASVTFAAPASGASAAFATSATVTTNSSGVATANTLTANTVAGSYTVTASSGGVSAPFSLTNTPGNPVSITATAGTPQSSVINTAFVTALQATVKDNFGNPVGSGVSVTFTAPGSGASGTFGASATVQTNSSGVATAPTFTANGVAGSYSVTANAGGVEGSATFSLTNTASAPAHITPTGTPQSATVNTAFGTAFQVTVTDTVGNPVIGAVVTFTAPSTGATGNFGGNATTTAQTNGSGVAVASTFTANTVAGSYTVTAATGTVSANFSLTNTPGAAASILATAGTPQSAGLGTTFATLLQATVKDQFGNPVSGVPVTFAAPASGAGGSFAGNAALTSNAQGIVTATAFTANTTIGSYSVTANAAGVATPATFSLTNTAGPPATMTPTGTPQTTTVNTAFGAALQVTVLDAGGNPVSGATVTFTAPPSGASARLSSSTATTNASGVANVTVTANTVAGSYTVGASAGNASTSFSLTNTAGVAASIAATAGTPQSAVINTAFAAALQATVKDAFGNVVSGVAVTFAAPASGPGGSFAAGSPVTNSAGVATSPTLLANATAGSFNATATAAGVATPASFALNNTSGTPFSMTPVGSPQSTTVGTAFSTALQVIVKDVGNNPVSGVVVTFTAPASGASGTFATSAVVQTNALGVATAPTFTANITAGTYQVSAAGSGLTATFTLTNTLAPFTAVPSSLVFFSNGGNPDPQTLTIASGGVPIGFTITGVPTWLTLPATTGTTTAAITVTANAGLVAVGTTTATLTITPANGAAAITVPVSFTKVNPPQTVLLATPPYVVFNYDRNSPLPDAQVVSITDLDGGAVTNPQLFYASSGNWLSASYAKTLRISVNPAGLPLGRYGSVVLVTSGSASVVVRVILEVTDPPVFLVSQLHMDFASTGSTPPAPQKLWVNSTVRPIGFTATAGTSGWLSVSPATATTLAPISVSVNPAGLSPGFHTDTITIQSNDATNSPVTVTVTVFVGP